MEQGRMPRQAHGSLDPRSAIEIYLSKVCGAHMPAKSCGGAIFFIQGMVTSHVGFAQATSAPRDGTSGLLAHKYGVSLKVVRDVWNLRTWTSVTMPYWTRSDRASFIRKQGLEGLVSMPPDPLPPPRSTSEVSGAFHLAHNTPMVAATHIPFQGGHPASRRLSEDGPFGHDEFQKQEAKLQEAAWAGYWAGIMPASARLGESLVAPPDLGLLQATGAASRAPAVVNPNHVATPHGFPAASHPHSFPAASHLEHSRCRHQISARINGSEMMRFEGLRGNQGHRSPTAQQDYNSPYMDVSRGDHAGRPYQVTVQTQIVPEQRAVFCASSSPNSLSSSSPPPVALDAFANVSSAHSALHPSLPPSQHPHRLLQDTANWATGHDLQFLVPSSSSPSSSSPESAVSLTRAGHVSSLGAGWATCSRCTNPTSTEWSVCCACGGSLVSRGY